MRPSSSSRFLYLMTTWPAVLVRGLIATLRPVDLARLASSSGLGRFGLRLGLGCESLDVSDGEVSVLDTAGERPLFLLGLAAQQRPSVAHGECST